MILTCPECSARYVIDPAALLPSGRMVRCAKCKHSWKEPAPDADTPMVDQAEATGPETQTPPDSKNDSKNDSSDGGKADNAQNAGKNNSTEIDKTQDTGDDTGEDEFAIKRARRKKRPRPLPKGSNLPALQNHKHGDILWGWYGLGAFVVVIVGSFLIFQTSISDIWPPAQKLYHALGMNNHDLGPKIDPENGHEMAEEQTKIPYDEQFKIENTTPSKTQTGKLVTLKVEGNIANLTDKTLPLPLLRISLKDSHGDTIREWNFKSSAATISKGEKVPFSTSLPNPPDNATTIHVTFAESH